MSKLVAASRTLLSALTVAALAGSLIGLALVLDRETNSPLSEQGVPEALIVPVDKTMQNPSVAVGLRVNSGTGRDVTLNNSGILTEILVAVGQEVGARTPLARMNNDLIVAQTSETPLFRDLETGAKGHDVTALQSFLKAGNLFPDEPDGTYGRTTAAAVRLFNESLGRPDLGTRFSLSTIAWIGPRPVVAGSVVGFVASSVGPGSVLFSIPQTAGSIGVSEPSSGLASPDAEHVLITGDVRVPYVAGSGLISAPTDVLAVATELAPNSEGAGRVEMAAPVPVVTVPAAAVVTDNAGIVCVFEDVVGSAVVITPLSSGVGSVDLPADTPLSQVLANPRETRDVTVCS